MSEKRYDPFRAAREALARGRVISAQSVHEDELLATLGPDVSNSYYVNGGTHERSPIHVQALIALQRQCVSPCRLPFEVRVPRIWLTKVAATHGVPIESLAVSQLKARSPAVAAWFGDPVPVCSHGPACAAYQLQVLQIRRKGHTIESLRGLARAAERDLSVDDPDLLLRFARALSVGAGRTRDLQSATAGERLSEIWLDRFSSTAGPIDKANLLRSVAFAQVASRGTLTALQTVRAAASELQEATHDSGSRDDVVSFQAREALFPTLETLALCEERWGDLENSLAAANELTERFPFDSRAWIRLAKSLFAAGDPSSAIDALITGARSEHPKWLFCIVTARLVAEHTGTSTTKIDDVASSYRVTNKQLEIT